MQFDTNFISVSFIAAFYKALFATLFNHLVLCNNAELPKWLKHSILWIKNFNFAHCVFNIITNFWLLLRTNSTTVWKPKSQQSRHTWKRKKSESKWCKNIEYAHEFINLQLATWLKAWPGRNSLNSSICDGKKYQGNRQNAILQRRLATTNNSRIQFRCSRNTKKLCCFYFPANVKPQISILFSASRQIIICYHVRQRVTCTSLEQVFVKSSVGCRLNLGRSGWIRSMRSFFRECKGILSVYSDKQPSNLAVNRF